MLTRNPYTSANSIQYSNYNILSGLNHKSPYRSKSPLSSQSQQVARDLNTFIIDNQHPCIIARSTIRAGSCRFGLYPQIASENATAGLSRDLIHFISDRKTIQHPYASFMAVFDEPISMSEKEFEEALWKQLSLLRDASSPYFEWDSSTTDDPSDPNFGFSFGGKAFYVVGMHANSSRLSRRFPLPMLVFNLHDQFEKMRSNGRYEKVKKIVRKNDEMLQGKINPMLQDFGKASEAKQYSGRHVGEHWKCPFLNP